MTTKLINIDELKTGMFIAELDVSWIKSPFFRHKRLISKIDDIKLLKKAGVKNVLIDLDKGIDFQQTDSSSVDSSSVDSVRTDRVAEKKTKSTIDKSPIVDVEPEVIPVILPSVASPSAPVSIQKEMKAATSIKNEVVNAVNTLNRQVEKGGAICVDAMSPIIDKTIESLQRNDQALLTLLHQSRRDGKLAAHTFGVFTISMLLAEELKLSDPDTEALALAAMLHDSGWSKLPSNLFAKGKKYSSAESKLVAQHIPILEKILGDTEAVSDTSRLIIHQHHELGDGSGYPQKLILKDINPLSRILTICDVYDELVHGIGESPGMVAANAVSKIYRSGKNGLFDEAMTAVLAKSMGVYPLGSGVLLNSGEKGVVIETNRDDPLAPVVKIHYDRTGQVMPNPKIIHLGCQSGDVVLSIDTVIDPHDSKVDPAGVLHLSGGT